jgi:hypothetical protein
MSTDAIMAGSVIKEAKLHAKARLTSTGKTVLPTITAQAEVQEEANHLNIINQVVIGAKEGATNAITKLVGSNITDTILRTPNGSNHKGIDNFRLFGVMQAAIDWANRPLTNDLLEQLLEVIKHTFGFCKKISVIMELLQSNVAQMAMYGIVIGVPQLVLTLLANIKTTTKADYGNKFFLAMHANCKKYTYNHVHNATSLQIILTELAGAIGVRALKDPAAPSAGMAHSMANSVSLTPTQSAPNRRTAPPPTANCWRRNTNHTVATARRTNKPRHAANRRRKQRRMPMRCQQRSHAPITKKSNAGSCSAQSSLVGRYGLSHI